MSGNQEDEYLETLEPWALTIPEAYITFVVATIQ
jgi:hypothetical protein